MISGISRHATLLMTALKSFSLCACGTAAVAPRSLMIVSLPDWPAAVRSYVFW
jgi:hypothetical protein